MTLHLLNDVVNDAESLQKYVINASLKSETMCNTRFAPLISTLPGSAFTTHVEWRSKPRDVNKHSQSLAW